MQFVNMLCYPTRRDCSVDYLRVVNGSPMKRSTVLIAIAFAKNLRPNASQSHQGSIVFHTYARDYVCCDFQGQQTPTSASRGRWLTWISSGLSPRAPFIRARRSLMTGASAWGSFTSFGGHHGPTQASWRQGGVANQRGKGSSRQGEQQGGSQMNITIRDQETRGAMAGNRIPCITPSSCFPS